MTYRVVYGETMPAWEQVFPTRREAVAFVAKCLDVGDLVFSVAKVVEGEPPRSMMAAIEASNAGKNAP